MIEIKNYIVKTVKDDPATVAEVQDKLDQVKPKYDKLHSNVVNRQAQLKNVIIGSQDFKTSLDEAIDKLNEMEGLLNQQEPVNAKYDVLAQQKLDHEVSPFALYIQKL